MVAAGVYNFYNIIIIGKISDGRNNESDNIIIIKWLVQYYLHIECHFTYYIIKYKHNSEYYNDAMWQSQQAML